MSDLAGTVALVRLALRRDRIRLATWVGALTLIVAVFASAIDELYPTVASRQAIAATIAANPALLAVLGPVFDLTTVGGLVAWRMSFLSIVLVPLMALLTVVRHTRAEEEEGRLELLGSTVMGRRAPLAAGLAVAAGASTLLGAAVAVSLVTLGEGVVGSIALGLSYALSGCTFAGVGAVAAQLTHSSRSATGIAVGVLGVSYLLRGIGDAAAGGAMSWLSWTPPLGWVLQVRPFAGERWWVAGLLAVLIAVLVAAADRLVARRDLGAGLLPPRPGPASASPRLRGPFGLAWRLHRPSLLGWSVGLFGLGAMYGGIAAGVVDLLTGTPELEEFFRRIGGELALIDAFLATTLGISGLIASGYVIQATLRLRSQETGLFAEQVLATSVGRTRWALSHVAVAAGGTAVLLAAAGLGTGLTHGLRVGDVSGEVPRLVAGGLVQLPAALVLGGIAVTLFGLAPRASGAAWGALVAFLVLGQLGPLLQLGQWAMNLSPFTHVPEIPGGEVRALPLVALTGVAAALTLAGLAGWRQREVG